MAERLDDPALDLAARAERVDHAADVVDRDDLLDDDLARADVHRDLGELDAEREDAHAGRVRPARALAEDLAVVEEAGDLLQRPRATVRGDDLAALQRQQPLLDARSAARRARSPGVRRRRPRSARPGPWTGASTSRRRRRRRGRGRSRRAGPSTRSRERPSSSAAICAIAVRVPVPMSCIAVTTFARPSEPSRTHA